MRRAALPVLVVLLALSSGTQAKLTLKEAATAPPTQLAEPIRKLLDDKSLQVLDAKGEMLCELWFRKAIPSKATDAQVQNGLTYQELEQTTLIGAVRFAQDARDYRNQHVKAGVYTLRIAHQPQDGDHMGTAPHVEFCLVMSAAHDKKPDAMDVKALHDHSSRALGGSHPGIFLLFPNPKPEATPKIVDQGMDHWVLRHALQIDVNGKKVPLGIGLTLAGVSSAA